jgi:hypothetical protein
MTTRTVTGTIKHPDNTAWAGASVYFRLLADLIIGDVVYPAETKTVTTDASGDFSVTLAVPASGTAAYEVQTPTETQRVYLAAGSAVDLSTLLTVPTVSDPPSALQTLLDTHVAGLHPGYEYIPTSPVTSASIQAAIDAASNAGGGVVLLPAGTITLNASLTPRAGVTIRGVYPGATTIMPNYWDLDTVDKGTVLTYPGGTIFEWIPDITGPQGALGGCCIESLGVDDADCVIKCGATNKYGLQASVVRDILASHITGIAFDLSNIINCHFSNLRAVCKQFLRVASDNDTSAGPNNDHLPGNSVFVDLYCQILPTGQALPSVHLQSVPNGGYGTHLNMLHFVRLQVNRLNLTSAASGYHLFMDGRDAYAGVNQCTFSGLDLEGKALYHLYGNWTNGAKIHSSIMTEDNVTLKLRNTYWCTIENNHAMKLDLDDTCIETTLIGGVDSLVGGGRYPLGVYTVRTTDNLRSVVHTHNGNPNAAYEFPAYANLYGQGDRTASVTVTTNFTNYYGGAGGALSQLVDGLKVNATSITYSPVDVTGKYWLFQFPAPVMIVEAKYYFDYPSYADGFFSTTSWQWQGSNTGNEWTAIGPLQTPMGVTTSPKTFTTMAENNLGYVYYRLIGISGTMAGWDVPQEWEFKIGNVL